ncbi:MAG: hypothetical protein HY887_00075 [Deltaproteobacteria bacterium]|nr:hypothetical protein [Deltaproteobacteria bacterium]
MRFFNSSYIWAVIFFTALVFAAAPGVSRAAGKAGAVKNANSADALNEAFTWYDGTTKKTAWLNPNLLAEFSGGASGAVTRAYPNAKSVAVRSASVKLWKINDGQPAKNAADHVRAATPGSNISYVFHDGPHTSSRKRVLTGNIIVSFDPSWNKDVVASWASSKGLGVLKKLDIGGNYYLLKEGPGFSTLEAANSISESGEVLSASPEWWVEAVTR